MVLKFTIKMVLLARLLMATSALITRYLWPVHSGLSSFRFACVIHLFLIASGGLHEVIGVRSGFKAFSSFNHFFQGDLSL